METKAELQAMGFELTPVLRAIRAKCLDCSGGSHAEVAECLVKKCALYPFRLGADHCRSLSQNSFAIFNAPSFQSLNHYRQTNSML